MSPQSVEIITLKILRIFKENLLRNEAILNTGMRNISYSLDDNNDIF